MSAPARSILACGSMFVAELTGWNPSMKEAEGRQTKPVHKCALTLMNKVEKILGESLLCEIDLQGRWGSFCCRLVCFVLGGRGVLGYGEQHNEFIFVSALRLVEYLKYDRVQMRGKTGSA